MEYLAPTEYWPNSQIEKTSRVKIGRFWSKYIYVHFLFEFVIEQWEDKDRATYVNRST